MRAAFITGYSGDSAVLATEKLATTWHDALAFR